MMKGWDAWRRKVPDYQGSRMGILLLFFLSSAIIGQGYLVLLESLPFLLPDVGVVRRFEAALPLVGTGTLVAIGFYFIAQVWLRRDGFLAENRETAYQRALPFGLVGIGCVFTTILNGFVPIYQLSQPGLQHELSILLSTPLAGSGSTGWPLRAVLGIAVFGLGLLHTRRSLRTFGMDSAALVYLYYPEESSMESHDIYSVIRHPIYTGWLLWMAGGTLFRLSLYGLLDFILFTAALILWLRWFEEPELIDRFGEDYREYRQEVPAFFPRPGSLRAYLRFLLGRD